MLTGARTSLTMISKKKNRRIPRTRKIALHEHDHHLYRKSHQGVVTTIPLLYFVSSIHFSLLSDSKMVCICIRDKMSHAKGGCISEKIIQKMLNLQCNRFNDILIIFSSHAHLNSRNFKMIYYS